MDSRERDHNTIKKANREALPKFMLFMAISLLGGGAVGFLSAKYGLDALAEGIKSAGMFFGANIAPWLMLVSAVILPAACVPVYGRAKKLLSSWDGENEEISDRIDKTISIIMWITSAAFIFSYPLIAASNANDLTAVPFFVSITAFFAIMIEAVMIQQKCVDTSKKMNPEKTASVYDIKFQKKWMDSCDEAEKIIIGKCAFRAYTATNMVCSVLSAVLAVCALIFGTGFLPSLVVCLIWIVNQSVYCKESLRYAKAGNKIS